MTLSIVLLSGGIDSAVALAKVRASGSDVEALLIDYGQRHGIELALAAAFAEHYGAAITRVRVGLPAMRPSDALVGQASVPKRRSLQTIASSGVPPTFVPGRNMVLLSLAFSLASMRRADAVVMGATMADAPGYPDCRPGFLDAFTGAAHAGTGDFTRLMAPWVYKTKAAVIAEGAALGVSFAATWSCYAPSSDVRHCGVCDACVMRRAGFVGAGVVDPTDYAGAP
jgi:7-cyano-7-deazaguanine synthase